MQRVRSAIVRYVSGFKIRSYQIIVDLDAQDDKLKKIFLTNFWIYV